MTVRIPELKLERTLQPGPDGRAELRLEARGLQLWSPEQPKLYDVEIASGRDVVRDRIGFRTIETRGRDILVNGQMDKLAGYFDGDDYVQHNPQIPDKLSGLGVAIYVAAPAGW